MEDEEYKEPLSPSYRNMNGYLNTAEAATIAIP